jgi:hypothetical protein
VGQVVAGQDSELLESAGDVVLHRARRKVEGGGDLSVAQARAGELGYFLLTGREFAAVAGAARAPGGAAVGSQLCPDAGRVPGRTQCVQLLCGDIQI